MISTQSDDESDRDDVTYVQHGLYQIRGEIFLKKKTFHDLIIVNKILNRIQLIQSVHSCMSSRATWQPRRRLS